MAAPEGERLVDAAPFGHWKTTTFVAGLCRNGIIAPLVLDEPMRGSSVTDDAEREALCS